MRNILVHKECIIDKCKNKSISVRGQNPYCREHVFKFCRLNSEKNIFNECRCNSTVSMMSSGDKLFCNAHFRTLIYKCNHKSCKILRNNNNISYDTKWYCKRHKKKQNKKVLTNIFLIFRNKLPPEIIEKIFTNHLKKDISI